VLKRLLRTASASAVSALLTRGAQLITAILYARHLSTTEFGIYGIIQTTALLFTTFFALNLGQMSTKLVVEASTTGIAPLEKAVLLSYKAGIAFSLPLFVALLFLSSPASLITTGTSNHWNLFAWAALLIPIGTAISIQNGIALGLGILRTQVTINLIAAPIIIAMGYLAAQENELSIAVYAFIGGQILIAIVQQIAINQTLSTRSIAPISQLKEKLDWTPITKYGIPSTIAGLLTMPSNWIAMVILANSSNGTHELGLFSYANQFKAIAYFAIGVLANAAIPQLAKFYTSNNYNSYKKLLSISTFSLVLALTIVTLGTAQGGNYIIQAITPLYASAHVPLVILLASCIPTAITSLLMRSGSARGSAREMLSANLVFSAALIASAIILQDHGAIGLTIAFLIGSLLQACVLIYKESQSLRAWRTSISVAK